MVRSKGWPLAVWLIAAGWGQVLHAAEEQDELAELQVRPTSNWQLLRDDRLHEVRTYVRQEDGRRYRSFRVEAAVSASAETLIRVFLDFENYRRWYWQVETCRLLKRASPTEYYLYLQHRAPFGLPDRDVILHAVVEPQTPTRHYITLRVEAVPDYLPAQPPYVRMSEEDMAVRFTPVSENRVLIEAEGYIDPGGSKVPSWAINLVQRSAPYAVVLGLQRMAERDEYRLARGRLPFPVLSDL